MLYYFLLLLLPTLAMAGESIALPDKSNDTPLTLSQPLTQSAKGFSPWQYTVGDFKVSLQGNDTNNARLAIYSSAKTADVHWQSLPGKSFILAADAQVTATSVGGSFNVTESTRSACLGHSIDSVTQVDDSKSKNTLTISGVLNCSALGDVHFSLNIAAVTAGELQFDLRVDHPSVGRTGLLFESNAKERVFGFGEQFSAFDFKGKRVPIIVEEQGLSRGAQPLTRRLDAIYEGIAGEWHSTYAPIPHFITTELRSMALENTEFSTIDLRSDNQIAMEVYSNHLLARLFVGETPLDIIERYTRFSGRMKPLPAWSTKGAIVGIQGGTETTLTAVTALQNEGASLSAVWLQDWEGQRRGPTGGSRLWWNWELDKNHYPNWGGMVKTLEADDVRVLGYINPYLIDIAATGREFRRNLYKEALDQDFLLKKSDGSLITLNQGSFTAYIVDISNQSAKKWLKEIIKTEMLGVGLSGWMADFGEALPWDAQLASGEDAAVVHNQYPETWAALNREVLDEAGVGDDVVFFMRAAFTKSPAYSSLFWAGDQTTNWDNFDGIKTSVTALLTSGLSGFSFNHSDVGGYASIKDPAEVRVRRTKELLSRWIELGAFQVIFRTHEGTMPDWSHQFDSDQETLEHFARFSKIYNAWNDYRQVLVAEAADKGWPVVRHPFLHYPQEQSFWSLSYQQYLIGSEMWFAPVLDPGVNEVSIHLPSGTWVHAFTGESYVSKSAEVAIRVPAPIGTPAVLYRQGSVVGKQFRQNLIANNVIEVH